MKNKINPFNETRRRIEIVTGLLSRIDADIVAPDGTFPDITVDRVGRLMSGGDIYLSLPNSENCFLETNSEYVTYSPETDCHLWSSSWKACINYRDQIPNPSKHAMKDKSYHLKIKLAGQRSRT